MVLRIPLAGWLLAAALLPGTLHAAPRKAVAKPAPKTPASAKAPVVGAYESFPAVGVKLQTPAGMVRAETWTGFAAERLRASVMLVKLAGPYAEVSSGFTAEDLAPRGMKLVSKAERKVEGLSGVLVYFTMAAGGTQWDKWALVFGDPTRTYMITGTFPSELRSRLTEPVKASLLSTRLEAEGAPGDELTFSLVASPKLKSTPVISGALTYTRDGSLPAKSPDAPFFIAAPSLVKSPVPARREFSEQRLRATEQTRITSVVSHEPIAIDDLDGFETLAEATDAKSGRSIVLYQVMLFDTDRYYLLQGVVGTDLREEYLPEFKALARSFRRKSRAATK